MKPHVPRDWEGESVFLVAGGESVSKVDLTLLKGYKTVLVNSSYLTVRTADALVFTDVRWWRKHYRRIRTMQLTGDICIGEIVTVSPNKPGLFNGLSVYDRQYSSGVATDPTRLAWFHTTVTTTLNWIMHKGAARVGILGLDGKGEWHHEPHPAEWGRNKSKFKLHAEALRAIAQPLQDAGVDVYNLNPDSAHQMFQFASIHEFISRCGPRMDASHNYGERLPIDKTERRATA